MKLVFVFATAGAVLLGQQTDFVVRTGGPQTAGVPATLAFLGEMVGGSPVTGAPYSAEAVTSTTQTLADGNRIVNKTSSKIYRDSAGRERREQPLPSLEPQAIGNMAAAMIMISDPVAKVNYSFDTRRKTATKMPGNGWAGARVNVAPGGRARVVTAQTAGIQTGFGNQTFIYQGRLAASGEPEPQQKKEDLGKSTIEGVIVEGTRTTITIPAGQVGNERPIEVVSERWYSPELKALVMSKDTDPRMGETVYQLTNVSRVEPLPSLFEVPSDYEITNDLTRIELKKQLVEPGAKD